MSDFIPDEPEVSPPLPHPVPSDSWKNWIITFFWGFWLIVLTVFFLIRFSFTFYFDNQDAIREFLGQ